MRERTPARIAMIALVCSLTLAAVALTSASWTGASVMMALAVQAIVAACHQGLLLKSLRASEEAPETSSSPETQFRSYAVAVLLYALGSGVALSEGVATLRETRAVVSPLLDVLALALSIGLQGAALILTLAFLHSGDDAESKAAPHKSPPIAALLIEHAGAIASLLIASLGVAFLALLEVVVADATAAIVIGLVMALVATVMSLEVRKALLRSRMQSVASIDQRTETATAAAAKTAASPAPRQTASEETQHPASATFARTHESDAHLSRKEKKRLKRQRA